MVLKSTLDKMFKKTNKLLKKITNEETMRLMGERTAEIIVDRTRGKGKGVKNQYGNPSKLKQVTPKYAKWRRKQERHPEAAKGRKCNLTFKGTMLDSLEVIDVKKNWFRIGWDDETEAAKAEKHHNDGRVIIYLSKKEANSLIKEFDVIVKKALKNI